MAAGGERVRVFLITIPGMRGNAWVAFNIQALLSSARLLAGAKSATKAAIKIMTRVEPPCTSRTRSRMPYLVEGHPRIRICTIRRSGCYVRGPRGGQLFSFALESQRRAGVAYIIETGCLAVDQRLRPRARIRCELRSGLRRGHRWTRLPGLAASCCRWYMTP
jgi:hypothetical protein